MIRDIVTVGSKVQVFQPAQMYGKQKDSGVLLFDALAREVTSESRLEVTVPDFLGELQKNICYILYLYAGQKVFRCSAYYQSSYHQDDGRVFCMEVVSPLQRVQRRMYQRVSCRGKLTFAVLQSDKNHAMIEEEPGFLDKEQFQGGQYWTDFMIDLSGGGLRFASGRRLSPGTILNILFEIMEGEEKKTIDLFGRVVHCEVLRNEQERFDIRVKFIQTPKEIIEQIIQFVFLIERKSIQ